MPTPNIYMYNVCVCVCEREYGKTGKLRMPFQSEGL